MISICLKCKIEKESTEFWKKSSRKNGLSAWCKSCYNDYISNHPKKLEWRANGNESRKAWKIKNKEKSKAQDIQSRRKRNQDPAYRIKDNLRNRIKYAILKSHRVYHSLDLIGCTIAEFRLHIESQFQKGMSWENYGFYGWHIDHIRPCSSFDLTNPEEQKKCFHYSNCQPLWAEDNLKKSDKYDFNSKKEFLK